MRKENMWGQIHAFSLLGIITGTLIITLMNHRRPSWKLLLTMVLSIHYSELVHGPDFIGEPVASYWLQKRTGIKNIQSVWQTWLTGLYSHQ